MERSGERCGILGRMERRDLAEASDPEADLVERARRGDSRAFEELVRSHLDRVWRVVWRILRHREDTEDVVQEVFMAAHGSLAGFRSGSRLGTWLHRIAVNRALNHRERSAEKLRRASIAIAPQGGEGGVERGRSAEPASPDETPLDSLERGELARRLRDCLEKLPRTFRAVLSLRVDEELSYERIAEIQRTAIGTVRSRLARARLSLRECMKGAVP